MYRLTRLCTIFNNIFERITGSFSIFLLVNSKDKTTNPYSNLLKKSSLVVLLLAIQAAVGAQEKSFQMSLTEPQNTQQHTISLEVDADLAHITGVDLTQQTLYNEVEQQLQMAQILVKNDPSLPRLVIRIKSVPTTDAYATFLQIAFFERAILQRNQSAFMAITWSQGTLLITSKKDYASEVTGTISSIIHSFILEYQKAFLAK